MYVDELIRIRLPQVRARFRPAEFARLCAVRLAVGDHACSVRIESVEGAGCFGLRRRWLVCPRCSRRTSVVAFDALSTWFGCRRCLRYRWRPSAAAAPHTRRRVRVDGDRWEGVGPDVP